MLGVLEEQLGHPAAADTALVQALAVAHSTQPAFIPIMLRYYSIQDKDSESGGEQRTGSIGIQRRAQQAANAPDIGD